MPTHRFDDRRHKKTLVWRPTSTNRFDKLDNFIVYGCPTTLPFGSGFPNPQRNKITCETMCDRIWNNTEHKEQALALWTFDWEMLFDCFLIYCSSTLLMSPQRCTTWENLLPTSKLLWNCSGKYYVTHTYLWSMGTIVTEGADYPDMPSRKKTKNPDVLVMFLALFCDKIPSHVCLGLFREGGRRRLPPLEIITVRLIHQCCAVGYDFVLRHTK